MNRFHFRNYLCRALPSAFVGGASCLLSVCRAGPVETFVSPDVNCHQGYATDGTNHYTIDTQRIEKRLNDANWTCVLTNPAPFAGLKNLDHLGDGKYCHGCLYIVGESWAGCNNFHDQSILVFDSATLGRLEVHDISAPGHEVSGLAVVPEAGPHGVIYVTSYCDGSRLFLYDLATFGFLGTLPLSQPIPMLQGITWHRKRFYVSCDTDGIYTIERSGKVKLVYLSHLPGNHEGLDYSQKELRWLIDGGANRKVLHYISF
jgi:hypothetical protein